MARAEETCPRRWGRGRLVAVAVAAVVVALLLPISGHGDFYLSTFNTSLILTDHPNFYHALADEPTGVLPTGLSGGPYGPLFYYPNAAWLGLLDALDLVNVGGWQHTTLDTVLRDVPVTFLLKLPYLAVYVLVALVMLRLFDDRRGETAALLWLVNPAVILYALLMGQNDAWAFLAAVFALLLGKHALERTNAGKQRETFLLALAAAAALAAGAATKLTPILLVPPFALVLGRSLRQKAAIAVAGGATFALLVLPFLWTSFFWDYGLFGTQTGKAERGDIALFAALYALLVAFLFVQRRRPAGQAFPMLVYSFLAVHALIYFFPDWNPQRSILMVGALALAVPQRRVFLLPYLAATAYALALTLEHGNELGSALFAPLTERALNFPPLEHAVPREPLTTILFWLGGLSWVAALAWLWLQRMRPAAYAPSPFLAPALLLSLGGYLAAVFTVGGEVAVETFPEGSTPQVVNAGDIFAFSFFSSRDDVRAISFSVLRGDALAKMAVVDGDGTVLASSERFSVEPGLNRIETGHIEGAKGRLFHVTLIPEEPLEIEMRQAPAEMAVASAALNGEALEGTAGFSVHVRTPRSALLSDAASRLGDEWKSVAASLIVCLGAVGLLAAPGLALLPARARMRSP